MSELPSLRDPPTQVEQLRKVKGLFLNLKRLLCTILSHRGKGDTLPHSCGLIPKGSSLLMRLSASILPSLIRNSSTICSERG